MTRSEHMNWCKERALEDLPHDLKNAFNSMISDKSKHSETEGNIGCELGMTMKLTYNINTNL